MEVLRGCPPLMETGATTGAAAEREHLAENPDAAGLLHLTLEAATSCCVIAMACEPIHDNLSHLALFVNRLPALPHGKQASN
jgi:hypothetical protein